jgi:adenylate kinase
VTDGPDGARSSDRLILVLVGAVGAGKGTQAAALSRELGLVTLASGNLFRQALRDGTPLGDQAREYMERGELVPDEITVAMIMDELAKPAAATGAILDGFPRTVGQARALDTTLAEHGERVRQVFYIEVPTEELIRRVAGRWICPQCGTPYHDQTNPPGVPGRCDKDGTALVQREDDRPEVVRARLEKQVPPMLEVVDHYDRAGIVTRLDGRQPIEALTAQMLALLRPVIGAR